MELNPLSGTPMQVGFSLSFSVIFNRKMPFFVHFDKK
jgi:hypothetical protein